MNAETIALATAALGAVGTAIGTLWKSLQGQHNANKARISSLEDKLDKLLREDREAMNEMLASCRDVIRHNAEVLEKLMEGKPR